MKSITEIIAIISVLTVALGVHRLYMYYDVFSIDISTYLDLSEVIQLQYFFLLLLGVGAFFVLLLTIGLISDDKFKFHGTESLMNFKVALSNFESYQFLLVVFVTVSFIFLCSGINIRHDAYDILRGQSVNEVTMITDDAMVVTDKVLVYVGKTKNYIFFFDRNKRQSKIFKTSDIQEIRFMKGLDHRNK